MSHFHMQHYSDVTPDTHRCYCFMYLQNWIR